MRIRERGRAHRLLPYVRNEQLAAADDREPMKALVLARALQAPVDAPAIRIVEHRDPPTVAVLAGKGCQRARSFAQDDFEVGSFAGGDAKQAAHGNALQP